MIKSQPTWNTPARIDGLPYTNWKRREGVTFAGTLDQCVTRWLDLAGYQQGNCSVGWGPTADGSYGTWSASAIGAYVRRNGLPPTMVARRGAAASPEVLARLTAMDRYDPPIREVPPPPSVTQTGKPNG